MTALNLNDTMGCTLIGVLFATLFYGFSCAQTMFYFYTYRKDKLRLKILVAFLWLLGTARAIVDAAYIWYFLVLNHATLEGLEKNPTQYGITEYLFAALMIVIVQLFYVHSIWIFLEGKWFRMPVTLTIVFLSLFSFGNGLAMLIELARHPAVKSALTFTILPGTMQPASAFLTDLYIATSLSVILKQQKTGLKGTDYLLSKLALYAIHRGIFTAVFELLELLTVSVCFQYN